MDKARKNVFIEETYSVIFAECHNLAARSCPPLQRVIVGSTASIGWKKDGAGDVIEDVITPNVNEMERRIIEV